MLARAARKLSKTIVKACKIFGVLFFALRILHKSFEPIAYLITVILLVTFVDDVIVRNQNYFKAFSRSQSPDISVFSVNIDGSDSEYRVENQYIVYVRGEHWNEHYGKISHIRDVEVFSSESPICAYLCNVSPATLSSIQRMPEVLRIEQDQLYSADKVDVYSGFTVKNIRPDKDDKKTFPNFYPVEINSPKCDADPAESLSSTKNVQITEKTDSWALDKLSNYGDVHDPEQYVHRYYANDGENVVVYIGDSYIVKTSDNSHSLSQVYTGVTSRNLVNEVKLVNHATLVASLVAGKKYGVAKNAEMVGIVIAEKAGLYYSNVIRAFYYIIKDYKLRKVTVSACKGEPKAILTLSIVMPYKFWGFEQLYKKILDLGIYIVLSAGNQSKIPCDTPMYADPKVLVVGASTIDNKKASFSNFGNCVNIYSPGENIKSVGIGDIDRLSTGTSFAAPLAAGVLAALISDPKNYEIPSEEIIRKILLCADEHYEPDLSGKKILIVNRGFNCSKGVINEDSMLHQVDSHLKIPQLKHMI